MLFESSHPLIDLKIARRALPLLIRSPELAAQVGRRSPALHQVYLRYIGPA
jgi:hypothetical protein